MPDIAVLENGNVLVSIPITLRESAGRKQIITDQKKFKAENDPIVLDIVRGFYWQEMIDSGKITNIRELAKIMNINESYVGRDDSPDNAFARNHPPCHSRRFAGGYQPC